jgi:hypothetical protein
MMCIHFMPESLRTRDASARVEPIHCRQVNTGSALITLLSSHVSALRTRASLKVIRLSGVVVVALCSPTAQAHDGEIGALFVSLLHMGLGAVAGMLIAIVALMIKSPARGVLLFGQAIGALALGAACGGFIGFLVAQWQGTKVEAERALEMFQIAVCSGDPLRIQQAFSAASTASSEQVAKVILSCLQTKPLQPEAYPALAAALASGFHNDDASKRWDFANATLAPRKSPQTCAVLDWIYAHRDERFLKIIFEQPIPRVCTSADGLALNWWLAVLGPQSEEDRTVTVTVERLRAYQDRADEQFRWAMLLSDLRVRLSDKPPNGPALIHELTACGEPRLIHLLLKDRAYADRDVQDASPKASAALSAQYFPTQTWIDRKKRRYTDLCSLELYEGKPQAKSIWEIDRAVAGAQVLSK